MILSLIRWCWRFFIFALAVSAGAGEAHAKATAIWKIETSEMGVAMDISGEGDVVRSGQGKWRAEAQIKIAKPDYVLFMGDWVEITGARLKQIAPQVYSLSVAVPVGISRIPVYLKDAVISQMVEQSWIELEVDFDPTTEWVYQLLGESGSGTHLAVSAAVGTNHYEDSRHHQADGLAYGFGFLGRALFPKSERFYGLADLTWIQLPVSTLGISGSRFRTEGGVGGVLFPLRSDWNISLGLSGYLDTMSVQGNRYGYNQLWGPCVFSEVLIDRFLWGKFSLRSGLGWAPVKKLQIVEVQRTETFFEGNYYIKGFPLILVGRYSDVKVMVYPVQVQSKNMEVKVGYSFDHRLLKLGWLKMRD